MARVTVEDCVVRVPNRFELVMKAAQRARDMAAGAALTIERDDDKNPVVALREIAEETVDLDELGDALIKGLQKHVEVDEPEEELEQFSMPGSGEPAETPGADGTADDAILQAARQGLDAETPSDGSEAMAGGFEDTNAPD